MNEIACQFGEHQRLAGVVTEPREGQVRGALILVSAGLLPRSGPFRLYTQLARRVAREGILTLRFDLGGIGDSQVAHGQPLRARTEHDIRAAVDFLCASRGVSQVSLGGLCSGAEDSLRYAAEDARVKRVVLIDPFAYRTSGWMARHLLYRLARRSLRVGGLYQALPLEPKRLVEYGYMEREESTRILSVMLAREVDVHFVYTGGMRERFNHAGQLPRMFPTLKLGSRVTVDHLPEMDHTQLLERDRQELVERICRRLVPQSSVAAVATENTSHP